MNLHHTSNVRWHLAVGAVLLLFVTSVLATEERQTPRNEGRVTDIAGILSTTERKNINDVLASYESETSHQIAVLLVPSLSGESIESFSLRVANTWALGQKGVNNGILITLAMKERRVRIEVGLGMEKFISKAAAQSIIERSMVPSFRKGEYAVGLKAGLEELMKEGRRFVVPRKHSDS